MKNVALLMDVRIASQKVVLRATNVVKKPAILEWSVKAGKVALSQYQSFVKVAKGM